MLKRWYKLFVAGYPTCCESHARRYFMVIYNVGDDLETQFKMSLS
jgi:hypothetical protein